MIRGRGAFALPLILVLIQCAAGPNGLMADEEVQVSTAETSIRANERSESTAKPVRVDVSSPVVILDSLINAYPGRITSLEIRDGDWSVLIDGRAFYWAEGRMLPADELENRDRYSKYSFRPNPPEVQPIRELNPEERERLSKMIDRRETRQDARSPAFMTALWGMEDFDSAEQTVIPIVFLGQRIRIHPNLEDVLASVEADILAAAEADVQIGSWLANIRSAGAYNWREIAGSANRSLHSFGIAIDLVPGNYGGKQAYWRWARDFYEDWWAVPHEDRYQVPERVVSIFEEHGFTWGGKWFLFDQIHFEYRPELVYLGRLARAD